MSTATTTGTRDVHDPHGHRDHEEPPRPPLARLAALELRKTVDTLAGRWILAVVALACVVLAAGQVFAGDEEAGELANWLGLQVAPLSLLLPVLAILVVTTEWGARTALGTFTLVPRRQRVLAAKLLATLALTLTTFALVAAVTVIATVLGSAVQGVPADWSITSWGLGLPLLVLTTNVLVGFAAGLLLLNATGAIVAFFAMKTLLPLAFLFFSSLAGAAPWIDPSIALSALDPVSPGALTPWLQLATASALWVLLPAAIGARRVQRAEIG